MHERLTPPPTNRFRKKSAWLIAALAIAVAGGCASAGDPASTGGAVEVSVAASQLPGLRYAWVPLPGTYTEQLDPRVLDPAFRQRLSSALDTTLAGKGYQRVDDPAQAQWLIAYRVGVRDVERPVGEPSPNAGPTRMNAMECTRNGCSQLVVPSNSGATLDPRRVSFIEGALLVEVLEPKTLEVLWRGRNTGTVRRSDGRQPRLNEIAARTLADLPRAKAN